MRVLLLYLNYECNNNNLYNIKRGALLIIIIITLVIVVVVVVALPIWYYYYYVGTRVAASSDAPATINHMCICAPRPQRQNVVVVTVARVLDILI